LERQSYRDFEVVVADTSSTDQTVEIAQGFMGRLPLKVVEDTAKGVSHGRNAGAAAGTGRCILFLDADSVFADDFLDIMMSEFRRRGLNIATARFWINSWNLFDIIGAVIMLTYCALVAHTRHPLAGGFCILVERAYHDKVGGFDPTYTLAEDHQYAASVVAAGGKFAYVYKTKIIFEMRRFIQQGRVKVFWKWMSSEWYRRTHGFKVDKDFNYGFGEHSEAPAKPGKPAGK
jgi:glycosyltransferase involved in cell wall biosynthesis